MEDEYVVYEEYPSHFEEFYYPSYEEAFSHCVRASKYCCCELYVRIKRFEKGCFE